MKDFVQTVKRRSAVRCFNIKMDEAIIRRRITRRKMLAARSSLDKTARAHEKALNALRKLKNIERGRSSKREILPDGTIAIDLTITSDEDGAAESAKKSADFFDLDDVENFKFTIINEEQKKPDKKLPGVIDGNLADFRNEQAVKTFEEKQAQIESILATMGMSDDE